MEQPQVAPRTRIGIPRAEITACLLRIALQQRHACGINASLGTVGEQAGGEVDDVVELTAAHLVVGCQLVEVVGGDTLRQRIVARTIASTDRREAQTVAQTAHTGEHLTPQIAVGRAGAQTAQGFLTPLRHVNVADDVFGGEAQGHRCSGNHLADAVPVLCHPGHKQVFLARHVAVGQQLAQTESLVSSPALVLLTVADRGTVAH